VKTAPEMTYIVSGGALNSTRTNKQTNKQLSTVDMVVQRRDGPRWLRELDDDDDDR